MFRVTLNQRDADFVTMTEDGEQLFKGSSLSLVVWDMDESSLRVLLKAMIAPGVDIWITPVEIVSETTHHFDDVGQDIRIDEEKP